MQSIVWILASHSDLNQGTLGANQMALIREKDSVRNRMCSYLVYIESYPGETQDLEQSK